MSSRHTPKGACSLQGESAGPMDIAGLLFLMRRSVSTSANAGARSISDFTRTAVPQKAQQAENARQGKLSGDLATLSDRLGELDASLEDMRRSIRIVLG